MDAAVYWLPPAKVADKKEYCVLRIGLGVTMLVAAAPLAAQASSTDVPRSTYIQVQDQEFGKIDADKNGQLTREEVEAFQRAAAVAQSGARARALFGQLDKDRNGQLSFAEFAATQGAAPQADGRPFIAQLDSNKDGRVSLIEHRAGKLVRFDSIDADKDGIVSAAEMRAAGVIK